MKNNLLAVTYAALPMMRRRGAGYYYPMNGGTGSVMNSRLGQWAWLFWSYHILVAILFLLALILLVILLWKKIQVMDEKSVSKEARKKE